MTRITMLAAALIEAVVVFGGAATAFAQAHVVTAVVTEERSPLASMSDGLTPLSLFIAAQVVIMSCLAIGSWLALRNHPETLDALEGRT